MKIKVSSKLKNLWLIYLFIAIILTIMPVWILILIPDYTAQLVSSIYSLSTLVIALIILAWLRVYVKTLDYELTDDGVAINQGVWWKHWKNIPYQKITNVKITQGPIARAFKIATIDLQTAGTGQSNLPEGRLHGIEDFNKVRDDLMKLIKKKPRSGD